MRIVGADCHLVAMKYGGSSREIWMEEGRRVNRQGMYTIIVHALEQSEQIVIRHIKKALLSWTPYQPAWRPLAHRCSPQSEANRE